MATHNDLGKQGENLAVQYLQKQGFIILETNYRFQKAEIDIIAQKQDILAVVEVKTRSQTKVNQPQEAVNAKKIKLLTQAIDHYIETHVKQSVHVRFDIIAIVINSNTYSLQHLPDAFLCF